MTVAPQGTSKGGTDRMLDHQKTLERKALLKRMRELSAEIQQYERTEQERALKGPEEKNQRAIEDLANPETNLRLQ